MNPGSNGEPERLEGEGVPILAEFIRHQDTTTWTSLSVLLAAQVVLIGLAYQFRAPFLPIIGFFLTLASFAILWRSDAYLRKYYELAKERVHPKDLPIFDVKVEGLPTFYILIVLHIILGMFWYSLSANLLGF